MAVASWMPAFVRNKQRQKVKKVEMNKGRKLERQKVQRLAAAIPALTRALGRRATCSIALHLEKGLLLPWERCRAGHDSR